MSSFFFCREKRNNLFQFSNITWISFIVSNSHFLIYEQILNEHRFYNLETATILLVHYFNITESLRDILKVVFSSFFYILRLMIEMV